MDPKAISDALEETLRRPNRCWEAALAMSFNPEESDSEND